MNKFTLLVLLVFLETNSKKIDDLKLTFDGIINEAKDETHILLNTEPLEMTLSYKFEGEDWVEITKTFVPANYEDFEFQFDLRIETFHFPFLIKRNHSKLTVTETNLQKSQLQNHTFEFLYQNKLQVQKYEYTEEHLNDKTEFTIEIVHAHRASLYKYRLEFDVMRLFTEDNSIWIGDFEESDITFTQSMSQDKKTSFQIALKHERRVLIV